MIADKDELIDKFIYFSKVKNPDYKNVSESDAFKDFRKRIKTY